MSTDHRHLLVIGIGAGDPDHLTLAAVKAMRRADVFFVLGKGPEKSSLTDLRRRMLDEHARAPYRVVEADDPWRDRTPAGRSEYTAAVHDWRSRRADVYERLIRDELAPGQTGAFLVWGDPALYDSTLGILSDIGARGGVAFDTEVVPGISSVSALAARHRITLNQVGRPVHITPARRLPEVRLNDDGDIVVMLDAQESFTGVEGDDVWIYWGAYLGTPDELLVSGRLSDVSGRISRLRAEARARHGWIMDTYLLRIVDEGPADGGTGAGRPSVPARRTLSDEPSERCGARQPGEPEELVVPVLRVADAATAVAWYRRLGFVKQWGHRFEPGSPAFVEIARGPVKLFLSEHTGDARPDTLIYLRVGDVDAVAAEFGVPVTTAPWAREVELSDPDGNRLRVGTPAG